MTRANVSDCLNWQHTECLALQEEDLEADYYFCHLCLPDRHARSITEHSRRKLQFVPIKPKSFVAATEYVKGSRRIETHRQRAYSTRAMLSRRAEQLRKRSIRKEEELEKDIEIIRSCLRLKSQDSNRKPTLLSTARKTSNSLPANPASSSPRQQSAVISHKHRSVVDQLCDATGLHRARLNTMLEVAEEALCLLDTSVRYHDASVEACCRARNGNRHNALEYIATIFPQECSMTRDLSEWLLCAASHQTIPQRSKQEPLSPRRNQLPFKVIKLIAPARKPIFSDAAPIPAST